MQATAKYEVNYEGADDCETTIIGDCRLLIREGSAIFVDSNNFTVFVVPMNRVFSIELINL